ncbi:MAG TPA: hypothetical protein VKP60_15770 [Magnetospirillaceae bacterium]|nr:hypothetical protein [Magnetospirillaceae bacterium]
MMRKVIAMGCLLLAGVSARAQAQGGEQLFLVPPAGWTIVAHDVKNNAEMTELTPPSQTAQNWTDKLKVELIQGKPLADVQTVLTSLIKAVHEDCDDIGAGQAQIAAENGYDTGIRAVACPKTKANPHGEIGLLKVILGRDRTYVISRLWSGKPYDKDKIPLPPQATQEWLSFMSKVVVCDPRDAKHPCPPTR